MPKLIMHCNYFERGYTVEQTFEKALQHGFDGVELRGVPRDEVMSRDDYLDLVASLKESSGLEVVLALRPDELADDTDIRRANLARWAHVLTRGLEMGVTTFNARCGKVPNPQAGPFEFDRAGSGAAREEHWQWAVEAWRQFGAMAHEGGARMGFETHTVCLTDTATATRGLIDRIDSPAVGANLDMGNIVLHPRGESLAQALQILRGRLYYTHLKNVYLVPGGGWIGCRLSDGVVDNHAFLRILMEQGYDGLLGLEVSGAGDRNYFARSDRAYVQETCRELGWE